MLVGQMLEGRCHGTCLGRTQLGEVAVGAKPMPERDDDGGGRPALEPRRTVMWKFGHVTEAYTARIVLDAPWLMPVLVVGHGRSS